MASNGIALSSIRQQQQQQGEREGRSNTARQGRASLPTTKQLQDLPYQSYVEGSPIPLSSLATCPQISQIMPRVGALKWPLRARDEAAPIPPLAFASACPSRARRRAMRSLSDPCGRGHRHEESGNGVRAKKACGLLRI